MAMDLTGLGMYTDYMTDVNRVNTENLEKKLENTASTKQKEDDALLDACKQFEAYLWEQIYKEMEKASRALLDDEEEDAYAANMTDFFKDTFVQQVSSQTVDERSNSLAQLLYEQAKRNYNL